MNARATLTLAALAIAGAAAVASPSPALATPTLANPILIAKNGETVICIATNVSTSSRSIQMALTSANGATVAQESHSIDPMKSAAISFAHPGNFPGFYVCHVDLQGAPRRSFRARVRTETDSQVLN